MTLTEIERRPYERLVEVADSRVLVALTPQDPDEWQKLGAKGCLLWRWMRADPMTVAVNVPNPKEYHRFHCYAGVKSLRRNEAHIGAYELLDIADAALTGFWIDQTPDNKLWLIRGPRAFLTQDGGVWWYYQEFSTNAYTRTLPIIP